MKKTRKCGKCGASISGPGPCPRCDDKPFGENTGFKRRTTLPPDHPVAIPGYLEDSHRELYPDGLEKVEEEECKHELDMGSLQIPHLDIPPKVVDGKIELVIDGNCIHCGSSCGMPVSISLSDVDW